MFKLNISIKGNPEIGAMRIVVLAPFILAGLSTTTIVSAAARPPFYGVWSCTMINDGNTVNAAEWWQERFDEKGVLVEAAPQPVKLSWRRLRSGIYKLSYADGGKAEIEVKEPWIFLRRTAEHRYLCLRKSPE